MSKINLNDAKVEAVGTVSGAHIDCTVEGCNLPLISKQSKFCEQHQREADCYYQQLHIDIDARSARTNRCTSCDYYGK